MKATEARHITERANERPKIDQAIEMAATSGTYQLVIAEERVSDSIELDLVLDGFDVSSLGCMPGYLTIAWRK